MFLKSPASDWVALDEAGSQADKSDSSAKAIAIPRMLRHILTPPKIFGHPLSGRHTGKIFFQCGPRGGTAAISQTHNTILPPGTQCIYGAGFGNPL